jgi:hypothetical protein
MIRLTFPCGASYDSIERIETRNGNRPRLAVFDSDSDVRGPLTDDGQRAHCFIGCPKPNRGRKHERCWPRDESKRPPPYRHVVTCLATQKEIAP